MLRDVWVVFEHGPRARAALDVAAELARRLGARLTLVHFAAAGDLDAVDLADDVPRELVGLDRVAPLRGYLQTLVATVGPHADRRVRIFTGQPGPQLADLLQWEQPDLVVAGRQRGGRVLRALTADASPALLRQTGCRLLLVGQPEPPDAEPLVLACASSAEHAAAATTAAQLGAALGWRAELTIAPSTRRARAACIADCRARRPRLVVAEHPRFAGLLGSAGRRQVVRLADAIACPVLVVPRTAAPPVAATAGDGLPIVAQVPVDAAPATSSHLLTHSQPAQPAARPAQRRRVTLLWQLFAANALVLATATLTLIVAPVSVSSRPVLAEAIVLSFGLLVMLAAHLVLLRRVLAPLRLLTDVMGTIDPHHPGRRLQASPAAATEVGALSDAFDAMLDRIEHERRTSAQRALSAQEDERLRIAREMHDQVGQTLTALTIQAERAAATDGPVDRALLAQIAQSALQGLDDVRRIGRELRPEALDDLGLGNALIALCRRMEAQSAVRVTPQLNLGARLRPEVELAVYRVAQEAITNALRHAHATRVGVALAVHEDAVQLVVTDDGRGMPDAITDDTAGLAGMRERALLIGGSLRLRSMPGAGTEVQLAIPLAEAVQ